MLKVVRIGMICTALMLVASTVTAQEAGEAFAGGIVEPDATGHGDHRGAEAPDSLDDVLGIAELDGHAVATRQGTHRR